MKGDANALRAGVAKSLPEADEIADLNLREKVIELHALALAETSYTRIEDMPLGDPGTPPLPIGTQADHYRGVARIAAAIAAELESVIGPLNIDRDVLIAGALCHDVGKAYEFDESNRARWEKNKHRTGLPAIRHPAYGVHLALSVGLPEPVIHCIGAHSLSGPGGLSGEGALVEASAETCIVQYADIVFWEALERVDLPTAAERDQA